MIRRSWCLAVFALVFLTGCGDGREEILRGTWEDGAGVRLGFGELEGRNHWFLTNTSRLEPFETPYWLEGEWKLNGDDEIQLTVEKEKWGGEDRPPRGDQLVYKIEVLTISGMNVSDRTGAVTAYKKIAQGE